MFVIDGNKDTRRLVAPTPGNVGFLMKCHSSILAFFNGMIKTPNDSLILVKAEVWAGSELVLCPKRMNL